MFFFFLLPFEDPETKGAFILLFILFMSFLWRKKLKLTRPSFSAACLEVAVAEQRRLLFYSNRHIKAQNSLS